MGMTRGRKWTYNMDRKSWSNYASTDSDYNQGTSGERVDLILYIYERENRY